MRWNHFGNDKARAMALGDVLLASAFADTTPSDAKLAVVHGQVAKVLGTSELPAEIVEHLERFDPTRCEFAASLNAVALAGASDRLALLKALALVMRADGNVSRKERSFALHLAVDLNVPLGDAIAIVGLPSRPETHPRPRGLPRPGQRPQPLQH